MTTLDLAVVESRWWTEGNTSVRALFDTIASIRKGNPDAYHYEMFNNGASLQEIVPRIARKSDIRNLVIATHGDGGGISGAEGNNRISRAVLRNILASIPNRSLNGLYLGTCSTANLDTVEFLLNGGRVRWVAGFSEEIGWLQGSAVDLYFWTSYYGSNRAGGERKRIRRVADRMELMRGLCDELGFNIFRRRLGPKGGVEPLLNGS